MISLLFVLDGIDLILTPNIYNSEEQLYRQIWGLQGAHVLPIPTWEILCKYIYVGNINRGIISLHTGDI